MSSSHALANRKEFTMEDTVGYVLLGSAVIPGLMGWSLSLKGLNEANTAVKKAKDVAHQALEATANSQRIAATASSEQAAVTAQATENVAMQLGTVGDAVTGVEDALKTLTGKLAPARVAFALATLLVVAALFALGVITASAGSSGGGTTTTSTTSTT
jgi:hypothetical protein